MPSPESRLSAGQQVYTKTTCLAVQWDGDLVLYRLSDNAVMWHSNTAGNGGALLKIQNDGNLVVHKADGGEGIGNAIWATNTFA
ncbi:hypothetical protein [Kitasatospora cineracea]|uniref:D-mannose binding lectin n=1 Tax=Kitasatospora cineracea TaxID=88074 RepID=A0A3N4R5K5_9ACTN|nr:hypothetical protein [Kitasatospora cineracea]RPE27896.1 D-mannose binding lectin [Kitasatospora cineracea]